MIVEIFDSHKIEQLKNYVMYKAERLFFYTVNLEGLVNELSWDEYVDTLCASEESRKTIRRSISMAYINFRLKSFYFENMENINWKINGYEELCQLYKNNEGSKKVYRFMIKAQIAYYRYLRKKDKSLRWNTFLILIMNDNSKAEVLKKHFFVD